MAEIFGFDCYSPREVAERVETVGVTKANLPVLSMSALGVLAGGFIGFGALFATIVLSDGALSFGIARVLAGMVFSLGLILVVVAGAELFTGNNLLVMAFVAGRIGAGKLLANFAIVYVANLVGAAGLAALVALAGHGGMNSGALGRTAVAIAAAKVALPFSEAFFRGVLCNVLVCLAVWLAMAGRSVADKILATVFPIAAFVAAGFEHSVANMYFIPLGIFLKEQFGVGVADSLNWIAFFRSLIPVTLGNVIGGAGMVGLIYHIIYRRGTAPPARNPP
ncbi:MAG TPA: formate/nitrite transporter family protein [Chthoniobacterales bacterium]